MKLKTNSKINRPKLALLLNDSVMTLTQCLASLENITRKLQKDETACHPLYEKVKHLKTLTWFEEEQRTNTINLWQDQFEELQQLHWMEARDQLDGHQRDLSSIKDQHQTFEAKVRDIMKQLERNLQVMPASLQEQVIISIAELTDWVQAAEKAAMSLSSTLTTLTEGQSYSAILDIKKWPMSRLMQWRGLPRSDVKR